MELLWTILLLISLFWKILFKSGPIVHRFGHLKNCIKKPLVAGPVVEYDGVEITTNSDEIYAECEKGESYQAIVKIATHKKNGKKLYFLENVANEPVLETVKE